MSVKWRRIILYTPLLCLILVVALLATLMGTTAGTRWLVQRLVDMAGEQIAVESVSGSLLDGLTFQGIRYRAEGLEVAVERLGLSLGISHLLDGRVVVTALRMEGVTATAAQADSGKPLETGIAAIEIALPVEVELRDGLIERIDLETGGSSLHLSRLRIAAKANAHGVVVKRLVVTADKFTARLAGRIGGAAPHPLKATLNWRFLMEGSVKAAGGLTVLGDLSALEFEHHLLQPIELSSEGTLVIAPSPEVQMTNRWRQMLLVDAMPIEIGVGQLDISGWMDHFKLSGGATIGGKQIPETRVRFDATGDSKQLTIDSLTLDTLGGVVTGKGWVGLSPTPDWRFTVDARGVDPGRHWPEWPGKLDLSARVRGKHLFIDVFSGQLRDWQVTGRGDIGMAQSGFFSKGLRLQTGAIELSVKGSVDEKLALDWRVDASDLTGFYPELAGSLIAKGSISGSLSNPEVDATVEGRRLRYQNYSAGLLTARVSASGQPDNVTLAGRIDVPAAKMWMPPSDEGPIHVDWHDVQLEASLENSQWRLYGVAKSDVGGDVEVRGQIDSQGELDGHMTATLSNLSFVEALSPAVRKLGGDVRADIRVGGHWQSPQPSGELQWRRGRVSIPLLGIQLEDINVSARAEGLQSIELTGALRSGSGQLNLDGQLQQAGTPSWQMRLGLSGEDFTVVDRPEARAQITPDLVLKGNARQLSLSGDLLIPSAKVKLKTLPATAVTVSRDTVLMKAQPIEDPFEQLALESQVSVRLGEKVRFSGFGLDLRLGGELQVTEKPRQTPEVYGELNVAEGHYEGYGQRLEIKQGRVLFQGSHDNPALDIRIERTAGDYLAGLEIGGMLKQPESQLYSEPPLSESEVMSILLTGKPLGGASQTDADVLMGIVGTAGLKQGQRLLDQLSNVFKVDVAKLETENGVDQSSLLLGKYLSPELYIFYSVGILNQIFAFGMEYQLTKQWRLEARSGERQSMDILYKIEH